MATKLIGRVDARVRNAVAAVADEPFRRDVQQAIPSLTDTRRDRRLLIR